MKSCIYSLTKFLISIAVGLCIALIPQPTELLTSSALIFLGVFIAMILIMIFRLLPDAIAVLLGLTMCYCFKVADFGTIFSGFASTTVWMVVALVGFATGIVNSGLIKRVAFYIMKRFKLSYNSQILAIMVTGVVLAPCIPNMLAKVAILAPFTVQISREFGFKQSSRGAAGLFSALLYPTNIFGLCFLSGSTMVYMLLGILNQNFSWLAWTGATIMWGIVCLIGFYLFNISYYKTNIPDLPATFIQDKLGEMGPMSPDEKYAAVVLVVGILAWITTSLTGLDSFVIAVVLWFLVIIRGLFSPEDISAKIPWAVIIVAGGITGLATLLSVTGVDEWLRTLLTPLLSSVVHNAIMLVLIVTVVTYVIRYFVVSMIATVTLMFAIFAPVCTALGVSPFIVVWCAYTAAQVWSLPFNNTTFLLAQGVAGELCDWKSSIPSCYCYMALNLLGNVCCIPVWHLLGIA